MTFKLSPGIRGPEHTHAGYSCVDETGCDAEVYFLCAQTVGGSVDFLSCQDASTGSAASAAKTCADQNSPALDFTKISTCFSGPQGTTLKANAATYFDKKFPAPVGVPHLEINGVPLDRSSYTEAGVLSKLCATGITAPACKKAIIV